MSWRPALNYDIEEINSILRPIIIHNNRKYPSVEYSLPQRDRSILTKKELDTLKNALSKELGIFYQDTLLEREKRRLSYSTKENSSTFFKTTINKGNNIFQLPPGDITENYFSIENLSHESISDIYFIINRKDWSSTDSILSSIIDGSFSDKEKALVIWNFLRDNVIHSLPPHKGIYVHDPVRLLNLSGYGICDDVATVFTVMARRAGLKSRVWGLNGHVVPEVFYENAWHMMDPDQGVFYLSLDNKNIASVEEISRLPDKLISRTYEPKFKNKERFIKLYRSTKDNSVESWYESVMSDSHKLRFSLRPKEKLTFFYHKKDFWYTSFNWLEPKSHSVMIDTLNLLEKDTFDFLEQRSIDYIREGKVVHLKTRSHNAYILWSYNLPYPIVDIELNMVIHPIDKSKVGIYFKNRNNDWTEVLINDQMFKNGELIVSFRRLLNNFNADPDYNCSLKIELDQTVSISKLISTAKAQLFPKSLPELKPGKNTFVLEGTKEYSAEFVLNYHKGKEIRRPEKIDLSIFPPDGGKINLEQLWGLSWDAVNEVKEYQIILSNQKNCLFPLSPNFYRYSDSNKISFNNEDRSFLNANNTHYWKIRSRYDGNKWSQWSDIFHFDVTANREVTKASKI